MTGPDWSHTSKMTSWGWFVTGWGAVCDRSHTSKMTGQRAVCTATDRTFYLYVTGHRPPPQPVTNRPPTGHFTSM